MPHGMTWQVLGMVAASALFWMVYIDSKDRFRPEPPLRLVGAFAIGMGAAIVALGAFALLTSFGGADASSEGWFGRTGHRLSNLITQPETTFDKAVLCFVFIGPIEEGAKVLAAWFLVFRWRVFDEPIDGFIYAAAIALGFASLENLLHLPNLPLAEQVARTLTLPITHCLFAAVWGFGVAHARLRMNPGPAFWLLQIGSIVLAALLHGLYDFLLIAYQWTFATSGLVLILWIAVIWRARGSVQAQRTRSLAITGKHSPVAITGTFPRVGSGRK
jgi:RsiW-degrading membrane proteinase PrsW (M82 family)